MACGCGKRARAAAVGKAIAGYRLTLPDGTVIPPADRSPFFSDAEARAEVRKQGGGTVTTEYRQAS